MRLTRSFRHALGLGLLFALYACGGDDSASAVGGGEVHAPWDTFCVATFTQDYTFVGPFGDVDLKVRKDSRYLLSDFGFVGSAGDILFLSNAGPVELAVDVESGAAVPFTSNCTEGNTDSYVGVFRSTTVFADEALTMPKCMLAEGTALSFGPLSYALVSGDLFASGGTYEVMFPGLAAACGGLTSGFVEARNTEIGSTTHTVLPLGSMLGPR